MTTDFRAHAEPAHRPSPGRLGALAGITPVAMFCVWVAISGWSGTASGILVAVTQIALGAVAAGWLVGRRLGRSVSSAVLGLIAYGFTAWVVLLPLNVAGSTWEQVQAGRASDVAAIVLAAGGYLVYGVVVGLYAFVYLLPFGAGWIVTFVILRWAFDR